MHAVVISCSTVIHAERLPIEPQPTAHTMGYRVDYRYPYILHARTIRGRSVMDYIGEGNKVTQRHGLEQA